MGRKMTLTLLILFSIVFFVSFSTRHFIYDIPKVWNIKQLESMHLPYADTSIKLGFVTEEYYNQIADRISYKTYPFYMPGNEPEGYYEWLANIDPVVNFKEQDLKTEAD